MFAIPSKLGTFVAVIRGPPRLNPFHAGMIASANLCAPKARRLRRSPERATLDEPFVVKIWPACEQRRNNEADRANPAIQLNRISL
jgi:hypothetical protein